VDVPDHLSLEHLRGKGLQPGEKAQPQVGTPAPSGRCVHTSIALLCSTRQLCDTSSLRGKGLQPGEKAQPQV